MTDKPPHETAARLASMSWENLEAIEFEGDGSVLFPDVLSKRNSKGQIITEPIMLRVPRNPDLRWARAKAREIFAADGLNPEENASLFDDCELVCTLSRCIRNTTPPHEPWEPDPLRLERYYDRNSLRQLWGKVNEISVLVNPQESELDEQTMLAIIAAIAEARNLLPLHVCASQSRENLVIFMADRLMSLMESRSSSEPSEP